MGEQDPLSRWEILGAWLRIWTPRRDAEVPPIPWRRVAIGALALAVVAAGAVAFFGPRISESKKSVAERQAEALAALEAREKRRLLSEQELHTGSGTRPAGRLTPAEERAARKQLLRQVEGSILADAQARVRTGALENEVVRTDCEPYPRSVKQRGPEETLASPLGRYACLAVTRDIILHGSDQGELGYPFWASVDFRDFTYAWCKINPKPGELTGGRTIVVPLPEECKLD